VRKIVAAGLVLLLVLAFGSYKQTQSAVFISCGSVSGGTTAVAKGAEWAEKFGTWVHNVAANPEQYRDPANVKKVVEGVLKDVIWFWLRAAYLGMRGEKPDPELTRLHDDAAKQAQQARDLCTPCPTASGPSPLASLQNSVTSPADNLSAAVAYKPTGSPEEVTRQAAARYFPANQVDTAVAVAHAESSFNPKARNNVQAGMLGLWQINLAAHRNLVGSKDWTDPSVNAWMAYQIWHDAGDSWKPWSTYTSGSYRKYLSSGSEAPERPTEVTGTAPGIGCQAGSMPDLRIATWNSYYGAKHPGSSGPSGVERIRKAMATIGAQSDIIGGQEFSEASHKQAANDGLGADWAIVAGDTAHPIWYRKSKFTLTSSESVKVFDRTDDYEGPSQGDRYVNTAVLRDIATGKTVTEINTHQLPKIEKSGKLNPAWPKRSALARKIWQTVTDSARAHMSEGPVIATGDYNMTSNDPEGLFSAAGLMSAASVFGDLKQATRTRDIDKVFYSAGTPASERVLGAFGSDHSARLVTFVGQTTSAATAGASTSGARTVKDPASGKTYTIPIPTGPRGVAVNFALDQLGDPYVWGAHGPDSWDCSGLVAGAWGKAGYHFTPQTEAMLRELPKTKMPQEGDLTYHPGHTQMILSGGLILEAPRTGLTVRIIEHNWMTPTAIFDPMAGAAA
jgi:cell wall-associated NlpC family hydrolase